MLVEHKGERVHRLIDEDEFTYVVVPRHSHVRHHLLVVLKEHKSGLIDCNENDLKAMSKPIFNWCSILKRMGYDTVYSGCYSDEKHVHYHLIPFKFMDAKGFKGSAMHWLGCKEMFSDQRSWDKLDDNGKEQRFKEIGSVVKELMSAKTSVSSAGWRILGFGKHPEIAATIQEKLRSLGFQATNFVLTDDEAGDARLVAELKQAEYDGVAIGGYINGQDAVNFPATTETTAWFNRLLNIIHRNAPKSKIILVRGPEDILPAIERVLGKNPSS